MPTGFNVGGTIGLIVGVFLCIGMGFYDGFVWLGMGGFLVGGIIGSGIQTNSGAPTVSKEEKERINMENYMKPYRDLFSKLPKSLVGKAGDVVVFANASLGLPAQDMPDELLKMGAAIATIQKEGTYGPITSTRRKKVEKLLDDFAEDMRTLLPVVNRGMDEAMNKGLGFGVIGSGADVALHSVMDTAERIKNVKMANRATNELINKKVSELASNIQSVLL